MKRPIQLSDHFTYRKLLQFVFPSIVMMIFTSIYGVVDGLFVSNYAGKTAFAAINLVMPFIMVLGGIGFMIGTGGTALVSKILGEGDQEKATLISITFLPNDRYLLENEKFKQIINQNSVAFAS